MLLFFATIGAATGALSAPWGTGWLTAHLTHPRTLSYISLQVQRQWEER